jgi:nucleoside-diphosphate-sugar epimerase
MRVLVLGGTRFTGPHIVNRLLSWGHSVTIFHRGLHLWRTKEGVEELIGDGDVLTESRQLLSEAKPDVIVDMIALTVDHARQLVDVFDKSEQRLVVISSIDVYRAYGRYRMTEPGPPDLVPLLEDDPLREKLLPESKTYDKVGVERVVEESARDRSTILRLPVIYGPEDPQHRFKAYLIQMTSDCSKICLTPELAEWRCATGYVEDVALAIALATKNSKAAGRIYNVADSFAFTQADYVRAIARAANWNGKVVTEANDSEPDDCDYSQHLIIDSTAIRRDLGYTEEVPVNEAFTRTVQWELKNTN